MIGKTFGPYHIVDKVGEGGMGEVYRARDTKLGRDVALKVLPPAFVLDVDRLARFRREAQILATLNHPNIAALYHLEESDGVSALVMELVEGETLADRIARGAIPLNEALPIAKQIAEALETAHDQGIVHRDLKPANIKVRPDGTVKVLDFGLAKLGEPGSGVRDPGSVPVFSMSPTITSPATMTTVGVLLGTAAYMSPEQARGKAVDKRSDLWAFGCVLYEMLTGRHAFEGDDVTDVIARIIEREIDFAVLPSATPAGIRRLLRRTLEKDRRRRLADASDARLEIEEALSAPGAESEVRQLDSVSQPAGWRRALPWAVTGLAVVLAIITAALWAPWRAVPRAAPLRLSAQLGVDASLATDQGAAAVLSPDGALLAFTAVKTENDAPLLYVRRLEQLQPGALAGTEGARNPFFSPDGQWIAFFAGGKLKKIAASGGAVVTLCDAPNGRGGTWTEDGSIIFSPNNTVNVVLMRVPAAGGTPEPFSTLDKGEVTQRWPQVLPGGKAVLYSSGASQTAWETGNLVAQPLPSGARKILLRGGYYGRYVPSGHLVFIREGTLFAAPFDLNRLEVTGPAVPAVEGILASPAVTGGAQFAVGGNGALVYVLGQLVSNNAPIQWMDRSGKLTSLRSMPANWSNPVFSPDGTRLAFDIGDGRQSDIWVYDIARDTLSRLTFDQADDQRPAWTPDGQRIAFSSKRGDGVTFNLYWQRADGTGEAARLTQSKNQQFAGAFHPTGKVLAFLEQSMQTGSDLMMLPIDGDEATGWKPGEPTVFLKTPLNESTPAFSPDGRWLAYLSNENGTNNVYVRPFPGPGGKWQISSGAADDPMWSPARRELFFSAPPGLRLMVAGYSVEGQSFRADKPTLVSDARFGVLPRSPSRDIAIHPDGQRFAIAPPAETANRISSVVFVFNFLDELRRLAPGKQP